MSDYYTAMGLWRKIDPVVKVCAQMKEEFRLGDGEIEVISSAGFPDDVIIEDQSFFAKVKLKQPFFPLVIGFCGTCTGIILAGGTGYIMNLNVGDKAPFSYVPTGIVAYEFSLLFAVIGSVLSLLYYAGLPNWSARAYDPEFTEGALGVLLKLYSREDQEKAAKIMERMGAYKIKKGVNDF
jgi:hypothetical protein